MGGQPCLGIGGPSDSVGLDSRSEEQQIRVDQPIAQALQEPGHVRLEPTRQPEQHLVLALPLLDEVEKGRDAFGEHGVQAGLGASRRDHPGDQLVDVVVDNPGEERLPSREERVDARP